MAWVVAPSNKLVMHFRDDRGKHSVVEMFVAASEVDPSAGAPAAISAAAAPLSDAALYETEVMIVAEQSTVPAFGTSPYDRPSDKAAYEFTCADGSIIHLQIPAPLALQFSNAWDVNLLQTQVVNLRLAMNANAKSQEGAAVVGVLNAHRRRPPRRKVQ